MHTSKLSSSSRNGLECAHATIDPDTSYNMNACVTSDGKCQSHSIGMGRHTPQCRQPRSDPGPSEESCFSYCPCYWYWLPVQLCGSPSNRWKRVQSHTSLQTLALTQATGRQTQQLNRFMTMTCDVQGIMRHSHTKILSLLIPIRCCVLPRALRWGVQVRLCQFHWQWRR